MIASTLAAAGCKACQQVQSTYCLKMTTAFTHVFVQSQDTNRGFTINASRHWPMLARENLVVKPLLKDEKSEKSETVAHVIDARMKLSVVGRVTGKRAAPYVGTKLNDIKPILMPISGQFLICGRSLKDEILWEYEIPFVYDKSSKSSVFMDQHKQVALLCGFNDDDALITIAVVFSPSI